LHVTGVQTCALPISSQNARTGKNGSYVLVNPTTRNTGTRYYLDKIVVHPKYKPNSSKQFDDIALFRTIKPMSGAKLAINKNQNAARKRVAWGRRGRA